VNTTHGQRRFHFIQFSTLLLTTLLGISMVGCAGAGKSIIRGRVIAGLVGQSVGTPAGDERFDELGIPDAKITILRKSDNKSRKQGAYTSTTSDEYGNFELVFAGGEYPRDAVLVRVEAEGIYTSRSQTFLPTDGDKLLCVVITRPDYVIPVPPEDKKNRSKKK